MNLHSAAFATAKTSSDSSSLRERLCATRALSSDLARPLSDEDQVAQAMDPRSGYDPSESTFYMFGYVVLGILFAWRAKCQFRRNIFSQAF